MVAVVVPDYDEAIAHYTQAWGFELWEDSVRTPEKRWVRVAPQEAPAPCFSPKPPPPPKKPPLGSRPEGASFSLCIVKTSTPMWRA